MALKNIVKKTKLNINMAKCKFTKGSNVHVKDKDLVGYIKDIYSENSRALYRVFSFKNRFLGDFCSYQLEKINELKITKDNFAEVALYCVKHNIRGWFVNDDGTWICVTNEDFGIKYDGNFIGNGITFDLEGKTSIGGQIVRFIPENAFEDIEENFGELKEKITNINEYDFVITSTEKMEFVYQYI